MGLSLPAGGELIYNGYTFGGATHVTATAEAVPDEAGRAVSYVKHTITVETILGAADPESLDPSLRSTGGDLRTIRRLLTKDGAALRFTGWGFGDISVNEGAVRDVRWGPKTRLLKWSPIAFCAACEVTWEVVTCIPLCNESPQRFDGIISINYAMRYSFDRGGNCTRTTEGHLLIAQTRDGKSVPDCADNYLSAVTVVAPLGFRRTHDRSLLADKSRLDFTITDEQIASNDPFPNFVTNITGSHTVENSFSELSTIHNHLGLTVELAPGVNGIWAWLVFHSIASRRINIARQQAQNRVIIENIRAEEGMFSRTHKFSISYEILRGLDQFLTATGLWTPLQTGSDWESWRESLQGSTFNRRGNAGLYHSAAGDYLVDMCDADPHMIIGDVQQDLPMPSIPIAPVYQNQLPPKEQSYKHFTTWVEPQRETPMDILTPIQDSEPEDTSDGDPTDDKFLWDVQPPEGSVNNIVQVGAKRLYTYRFRGYATRVGYPVPRPRLIAVGGRIAYEKKARFLNRIVGNQFGVPIYQGAWDVHYVLSGPPDGEVKPPKRAIPDPGAA